MAPEFESFRIWSFWSFTLYSPECLLTRYAILCFHSSNRLEFWVLVLCEVMSETYWYPTWLPFYLHHGTSLQYFRRFARRQIRWSRRWCNGITQPPLHALINFFLEFNSWPRHTTIAVFFLSASLFHQSYYVITPRGLDLTHSRGHSSKWTTFASFARNTPRASQSQRVTTEIVLPSHIGLFPDFTQMHIVCCYISHFIRVR